MKYLVFFVKDEDWNQLDFSWFVSLAILYTEL